MFGTESYTQCYTTHMLNQCHCLSGRIHDHVLLLRVIFEVYFTVIKHDFYRLLKICNVFYVYKYIIIFISIYSF